MPWVFKMEFDGREYLEQLSPYELIELTFTVRNSLTEDVAMFMTALFAYLGSMYFVGSRLQTSQVVFASTAYSIFQALVVFSIVGLLQGLSDVSYVISGAESSGLILMATPILLVFVWIGSLVFAGQIVRTKDS